MIITLKKKRILLSIVALFISLYVLNITVLRIFSLLGNLWPSFSQQYLINTTGCKISFLDIHAEEIMVLLGKPNFDYNCGIPLIYSDLNSLYLNQSVFKEYEILNINHIFCHYEPFWRVDPTGTEEDHDIVFGKPRPFNSSIKVEEEFVKVECSYNGHTHIDFHSFVPDKKPISKFDTTRAIDDEKLNIIILGIHSLSRLHFHRKMPRTAKFLIEKMKAIEYFGYNKVADNTFLNLLPLLTGYRSIELMKLCWHNYESKFDNCSFIFQNYSKNGYILNFAEEYSEAGIFNYFKKGWFKQPTDYYWKTFDYTALKQVSSYSTDKTYPLCMSTRPMYRVLLQSGEKFISKMKNHRFFSFLWTSTLTHDNLDTATLGEDDYINHLEFLNESGVLNNTILIFMSDHGHKFGNIAETYQGNIEERLPFLFFALPPWFQTKYPIAMDNMKKNAYRLTTPYDLHATLNHILHPNQLTDEYLRNKHDSGEKSVSLFIPISPHRTCNSADILENWCTCEGSPSVKHLHERQYTNDERVRKWKIMNLKYHHEAK